MILFLILAFPFFFFAFALFISSLQWHNPTCLNRIAQQLILLRFGAESTLSVVFSSLGLVPTEHPSLPLRDGMDGIMGFPCHESTCCLLWAGGIQDCLAVCVQGTVYFYFDSQEFFSSSLAHILFSLWASQLGKLSIDLVFPRSISCREKWKNLSYAKE